MPVCSPEVLEQRAQRILEAASRCMLDKGYSATTMADIARDAGMSVGNLYNYFPGKEAIVERFAVERLLKIEQELDQMMTASVDTEVVSEVLIETIEKNLDFHTARVTLEIFTESTRNEKLALIIQAFDTKIREALMRLYPKTISVQEREVLVHCNMAMIEGLVFRIVAHPNLDKGKLKQLVLHRIRSTK